MRFKSCDQSICWQESSLSFLFGDPTVHCKNSPFLNWSIASQCKTRRLVITFILCYSSINHGKIQDWFYLNSYTSSTSLSNFSKIQKSMNLSNRVFSSRLGLKRLPRKQHEYYKLFSYLTKFQQVYEMLLLFRSICSKIPNVVIHRDIKSTLIKFMRLHRKNR